MQFSHRHAMFLSFNTKRNLSGGINLSSLDSSRYKFDPVRIMAIQGGEKGRFFCESGEWRCS